MDEPRRLTVGAADGVISLELCEAAYLSSRIGGAVKLPLSTFEANARPHWDAGRPYNGSGGGRDGRRLPVMP